MAMAAWSSRATQVRSSSGGSGHVAWSHGETGDAEQALRRDDGAEQVADLRQSAGEEAGRFLLVECPAGGGHFGGVQRLVGRPGGGGAEFADFVGDEDDGGAGEAGIEVAGNGVEHAILPVGAGELAGKVEQSLALAGLLARQVDLFAQARRQLPRPPKRRR